MQLSSQDIVETSDGSLSMYHPGVGEDFHSSTGARTEARELYVARSGYLNALLHGGDIRVLDVGLGLGYNALLTWDTWFKSNSPGTLTMMSLEKEVSLVEGLRVGSGPWMKDWTSEEKVRSGQLVPTEYGYCCQFTHTSGVNGRWQVFLGDALSGHWLDEVDKPFDFIWQDAFSPKKCPGLWSPQWFCLLQPICKRDATLMTYSVARQVCQALEQAGFCWEKIPAMGHKRHWLRATPVTGEVYGTLP